MDTRPPEPSPPEPPADDLAVEEAADATGQTGPDARAPVLVIAHEWLDVSAVMAALDALGLKSVVRHRGSFLDDYFVSGAYSAVLLADQTNDLSAKLSLMTSATLPDDATPCAILVQDKERRDREHLETYAPLVDLVDCPAALVAFLAGRLSLDAAA